MNARVRNQLTRAYNAILYKNGLIRPTYEKTQLASAKYDQMKLRNKMTANWKEIADRTGFNYDGTPKV